MRTEIDAELERRIPRLGEVIDSDDPADPHLDLPEVVQRGRHVRIIDGVADVFHRPTAWEIAADKKVFRMTWDDGQLTEYGQELRQGPRAVVVLLGTALTGMGRRRRDGTRHVRGTVAPEKRGGGRRAASRPGARG